jgi:4-hydroxy-tetrahydrodipicolinate reductase
MTGIGIFGAAGRMGREIAQEIAARGLTLTGGTDRPGSNATLADGRAIGSDAAALAALSDILIDFSAPGALAANLNACIASGSPS